MIYHYVYNPAFSFYPAPEPEKPKRDPGYPHQCIFCGEDAYVAFTTIEHRDPDWDKFCVGETKGTKRDPG